MNQRLTIELPDAVVERLRDTAKKSGTSIEEVAAAYVAAQAESEVRPHVARLFDDVISEYRELYRELS